MPHTNICGSRLLIELAGIGIGRNRIEEREEEELRVAGVGFDRCVIITSTFAAAAALKRPTRCRRSGSVGGGRADQCVCGAASAAFLL